MACNWNYGGYGRASDDSDQLAFIRQAERATADIAPSLDQLIHSNRLSKGLWHPNGFATFEIQLRDDVGLIRLHVWPTHLRRKSEGHPEIHQHSFRLYSRILAGTYVERFFKVVSRQDGSDRDGSESTTGMVLHAYQVKPTPREEPDDVVELGIDVVVRQDGQDIRCPTGSWHDIENDVFHSTPIPAEEFVATLAVLGPRVSSRGEVLLGRQGYECRSRARERVTENDQRQILSEYLRATGRATVSKP